MSRLNVAWAVQQIDSFIHASDRVGSSTPGIFTVSQREPSPVVAERAYVVEQILDQVLPGWRSRLRPASRQWDPLREQAARARAALLREEELAANLGDGAPMLDAGKLHPWVWEGARSLWQTNHYRKALAEAGTHVSARTQAKVGRRDKSETALLRESFSSDGPKPGMPRLRLMPDDGSDTFKSIHRGAAALAEGLYAGVRNPNTHDVQDELPEQVALEQLAAWSVLARWIDAAVVEGRP